MRPTYSYYILFNSIFQLDVNHHGWCRKAPLVNFMREPPFFFTIFIFSHECVYWHALVQLLQIFGSWVHVNACFFAFLCNLWSYLLIRQRRHTARHLHHRCILCSLIVRYWISLVHFISYACVDWMNITRSTMFLWCSTLNAWCHISCCFAIIYSLIVHQCTIAWLKFEVIKTIYVNKFMKWLSCWY